MPGEKQFAYEKRFQLDIDCLSSLFIGCMEEGGGKEKMQRTNVACNRPLPPFSKENFIL